MELEYLITIKTNKMKKEKTINIAMRCNKEQWSCIENKLKGNIVFNSISRDRFEEYNYIVNCDEKMISNVNKEGFDHVWKSVVETHETWNEKVFLEACGISEEPKFEITKEQILLLKEKCKKGSVSESRLKEWFPEVSETVFKTGYYKHKNGEHPKWFSYANFETKEYYGRGVLGDWFRGNAEYHLKYITSSCEPMSTEEVTEALKKEALKLGFVDGAYFKHGVVNIPRRVHGQEFEYDTERNELRINGFTILLNGKWIAEIIPTKTIKEAEELLKELGHNFKIV